MYNMFDKVVFSTLLTHLKKILVIEPILDQKYSEIIFPLFTAIIL